MTIAEQSTPMARAYNTFTAKIAAGGPTSNAIDARGYSGGGVRMDTAMTGDALTFTVSNSTDGVFTILADGAGSDVTLVVQGSRAYALPADLFGFAYFKIVSDENEAAQRWCYVDLIS